MDYSDFANLYNYGMFFFANFSCVSCMVKGYWTQVFIKRLELATKT
jgi:hypothetical protein